MNREHLEKAMRTLDRISEVMAKDGSLSEDLKNDIQETLLALAEEHLIEEVGDFSMEEVDLETGLDLILAAFKLADQRSEDRADRVKIHLEIGDTLYNMGRWREAQAYYELASKAAEESGHQYDLGRTLHRIGRLTRRQGRWHQARQALNRAVKIFKSLDRTIDEAETLLHIGNIEFKQGAYDQVTRR